MNTWHTFTSAIPAPPGSSILDRRQQGGALIGSLLLAALLPCGPDALYRRPDGLFEGPLPAPAPNNVGPSPRWPLHAASLVMLPMMCRLPLMVGWCRDTGVSPSVVLALHFAAMFGPATLFKLGRVTIAVKAPTCCTALLVVGRAAWKLAPGASAMWWLALAHGGAWSVAWAARTKAESERCLHRPSARLKTLGGALLNALLVLALGGAMSIAGFDALAAAQVALGTLVAIGLAARGGRSMLKFFGAKIRATRARRKTICRRTAGVSTNSQMAVVCETCATLNRDAAQYGSVALITGR